jgi:hypothetical protein
VKRKPTFASSSSGSSEIKRISHLSTKHSFQLNHENFFILARLADKFIIPHLLTTLTYYSHTLVATIKPSYDLWLSAARYEIRVVEKHCRNAARSEVSRVLAEKGISYFLVNMGIAPGQMDGILMDLLRVKDKYVANRQAMQGLN